MHPKLRNCAAALSAKGLAPTTFFTITDIVTDPNGSVVSNAEIVLANVDTDDH